MTGRRGALALPWFAAGAVPDREERPWDWPGAVRRWRAAGVAGGPARPLACPLPGRRQSSGHLPVGGLRGWPGLTWHSADAGRAAASDNELTAAEDGGAIEERDLPDLPPPAPAPTRDDEQLLRAARRGDLDAFNLLVLRYERAVFNICLRLLRDIASAEDVTQDTFVKAWQGIRTFRGDAVRPWLLRIATNACYDLLRVRGRRPAASLEAEPFEIEPIWTSQSPGDERPEAHALRRELSIHIERALIALPEDQRTVVLLVDVHGCDYQEVAAVTGAALGTVKSRLSRARARLRQTLRDDPEAGELFERYSRHYDEQGEATQP